MGGKDSDYIVGANHTNTRSDKEEGKFFTVDCGKRDLTNVNSPD